MLTVTDIVTAERLGLATAKLINPNGEAVQPTADSINSAISEFVDSGVEGVKISSPNLSKDESYPLSTLTYAAIDVCRATIQELKSYTSLLKYIVGDGQEVGPGKGQIPNGYVPLDETQIAQAKKATTVIGSEISNPVCLEHAVVATDDSVTTLPSFPTGSSGTPVPDVVAAPTGKFPGDPNSALRYSMLSALCFGIPMIAGGQSLIRKAKSL
jgi:hypothetical protein